MTEAQAPSTPQQLSEYLNERLDIGIREASPDALLDDLGFDSLQRYEILLTIEDLGVVLDDDDVSTCKTLQDLFRLYFAATKVSNDR